MSKKQIEKATKTIEEYNKLLENGKVTREPAKKHGAYSFLRNYKIGEDKKEILNYVQEERKKWMKQLGGTKLLTHMEVSLLDEATRLLLYCTLINDFVLSGNDDLVFHDLKTGEIIMHSALSKNYLAFTKTYVGILKDLNKIANDRKPVKDEDEIDPAWVKEEATKQRKLNKNEIS